MLERTPKTFRRLSLLMAATFICTLLFSLGAAARGTVRVTNKSPKERDGQWNIKLVIDYGSKPHLTQVPMVFSFEHKVRYKFFTDDKHKTPTMAREHLSNQTPTRMTVDIGFGDVGGDIFKITKFDLPIGREANEVEAGEYDMTVKLANGQQIGRKMRIKLMGKNKVIDYSSIKFKAKEPAKPKPTEEPDEPVDDTPRAAEDGGPDLSDIPDYEGPDDTIGPPEVEKKQGGCGCRVVAPSNSSSDHSHNALWLFASAAAAMVVMRRRSNR